LKFKSLNFLNKNNLLSKFIERLPSIKSKQAVLLYKNKIHTYVSIPNTPLFSKIEVNMNLMPPIDVLFIKPPGIELTQIASGESICDLSQRKVDY
jgi:hypothetical protein